jgi:hypothetical protein
VTTVSIRQAFSDVRVHEQCFLVSLAVNVRVNEHRPTLTPPVSMVPQQIETKFQRLHPCFWVLTFQRCHYQVTTWRHIPEIEDRGRQSSILINISRYNHG